MSEWRPTLRSVQPEPPFVETRRLATSDPLVVVRGAAVEDRAGAVGTA
jgi:hypothetical protein